MSNDVGVWVAIAIALFVGLVILFVTDGWSKLVGVGVIVGTVVAFIKAVHT